MEFGINALLCSLLGLVMTGAKHEILAIFLNLKILVFQGFEGEDAF